MPHVILQTPLTPAAMLAQFERHTFAAGDGIHITFLAAFISHNQAALLYELNINEPTIEQHVALMLFPRETPGEYTIRYTALGTPRITDGLHHATHYLADWLARLHPAARILADRTKT